jgi:hypothetical protein
MEIMRKVKGAYLATTLLKTLGGGGGGGFCCCGIFPTIIRCWSITENSQEKGD